MRDAKWVFLVPDSDKNLKTHHAKILISAIDKDQYGWGNLTHKPLSPEANFCVIRGQDKDSRPMLERLASELVEATESIAFEEMNLMRINNKLEFRRIYFPIIITTAQLQICRFDPDNDIEIKNGELSNAEFEVVPLVRFRKSLTTRLSNNITPKNLQQAAIEKERTVFVINVSYFEQILKEWDMTWPWVN